MARRKKTRRIEPLIVLGFALFTALMIGLALLLARSRPWWLVAGAIALGAIMVGVVHARLSHWRR